MKRTTILFLIAATLTVVSCTNTAAPPPSVEPKGEDRYLIDPRAGFDRPTNPAVDRSLDAAWRAFLSGDYATARKNIDDARQKEPGYPPVGLAEAAVDMRDGKYEQAAKLIERARTKSPDDLAARVYEAELAFIQQKTRRALELYRDLAQRPDAPASVKERLAQLEKNSFDELFRDAQSAPDSEAIRLLREALALNSSAEAARLLLVQKLVAAKEYEEARHELDPIVNGGNADSDEIQAELAEIEAGTGQYQQAIVRFERLARRDARYNSRLEDVKEQWTAANMPPQFRRAFEAESLTRAELAVLMYWKLPAIRFAQNLAAPPIATDIADVPGREELVRAMALGIFAVDPITRRVNPNGAVSAATLTRILGRVLVLRGSTCVKTLAPEPNELLRAQKMLAACDITDPTNAATPPDTVVSGRTATVALEQVEKTAK